MAQPRPPGVRTLPPWIDSYGRPGVGPPPAHLERPAATVQPHHNNSPAETQRRPVRGSQSSGSNTISQNGLATRISHSSGSAGGARRQQQLTLSQSSPDGYTDSHSSQDQLPLQKLRPRNLQQFLAGKGPSKWDHLRSAEPVIVPKRPARSQQSWHEYLVSSTYGRSPNEHSEIVSQEYLDNMQPGLNTPVQLPGLPSSSGGATGTAATSRLSRLRKRPRTPPFFERLLLAPVRHPLGPLFCRLTVLSTSIIALALAATILRQSSTENGEVRNKERGQAIFAIAVDTVAIPYIGYIMWDENLGPPLVGVERTKERVKLILMDLFFIMFKAASTGLAFESLIYTEDLGARPLLETLAAFELVGLISWALTLIANVFRVVERLGGRGESRMPEEKQPGGEV